MFISSWHSLLSSDQTTTYKHKMQTALLRAMSGVSSFCTAYKRPFRCHAHITISTE